MITIKEFPVETVGLYSPEGEFLGALDQNQFLDVRIQIAEQRLSGYYILGSAGKRLIEENGELNESMEGVFKTTITLSRRLWALIKADVNLAE
jgi:hypothetical protein